LGWVGRVSVCVATLILASIASLPVGMRFFGSREPVTHGEVMSAIVTYLTLLAVYLLIIVVVQGAAQSIRRLARRAEPDRDSRPAS
jgi:predicted neutral ceramidase superfamily lipid hydrolase